MSLKNPENLGRDSIPITLGRVSSAFFLTKAFAGRINKKELIHANLWEGRVHPMPTSSHASFPAQDTGPCCPSHQNGAFEFPIHIVFAICVTTIRI